VLKTDAVEEPASDRLVRQRIRNRIIENLELAASFELQQDYESRVPFITAFEVLEGWNDWLRADPRRELPHAVLTIDEVAALGPVHVCIEEATIELRQYEFPTMEQAQGLPKWSALRDQSAVALAVLSQRGRMSEDVEEE